MFAGRWLFGVAQRDPRWPHAAGSVPALHRPAELLRSLGWDVEGRLRPNETRHLRSDHTAAEIVVLVAGPGEHEDARHADRVSDSARQLTADHQREPPLAAVAAGPVWRVFRPGEQPRPSVYVDVEAAGGEYVHAILGPGGLPDPAFFQWALDDSRRYAAALSDELRKRICKTAMPRLAEATAAAMRRRDPEASLDTAFQAAVRVLFRLLLIAWAEDEGILPYDRNDEYRRKSLTQLALKLAKDPALGSGNGRGYVMSKDLDVLWAAFDGGNEEMGVPAYNGGLFDDETPIGRAVADLRLPDAAVADVLRTLLTTTGTDDEPAGMVDLSGMSVREFGTIYEELLEYRLSEAPEDLTADLEPVDDAPGCDAEIAYAAGDPYLHDKSGQRKSTGSYFTKPFAVDHLLDQALRPVLEEHLDRVLAVLDTEGDTAASEALWDFAVLDPASGSGHFLVAACDVISEEFAKFQDNNSLQGVDAALAKMRAAAETALAGRDPAAEAMIADTDLIARQVARKCLYAIDISEMATELCRVSIWMHTFVPGLPMYSLDHQIVSGNMLLSITSVEEAVELLDPPKQRQGSRSLIGVAARDAIERGLAHEMTARRYDEADYSEAEATAEARAEADKALAPARHLLDAALAVRLKYLPTDRKGVIPDTTDAESIAAKMRTDDNTDGPVYAALRALDPMGRRPTHPPVLFPEVYRADRPAGPGFDCCLGNPPWEKVIVDREAWWGIHMPGVRSKPVALRRADIDAFEAGHPLLAEEFEADKQHAKSLKKALRTVFPDLGSGHTDLYKAFCWANLAAVRDGGTVGMVLPRSAVSDAGMAKWRRRLLENAAGGGRRCVVSTATVINHKGWAFTGIHNSYTVTLTAFRSSASSPVSTPSSGPSTESTGVTHSASSQHANPTHDKTTRGVFDDLDETPDPDEAPDGGEEPYVAIYPGPAASQEEYDAIAAGGPEHVPVSEFARWSNTAAFPQIPTKDAFKVWRKIKQHPRFDGQDLSGQVRSGQVRTGQDRTGQDRTGHPILPPSMEVPTGSGRPQRHDRPAPVPPRRWAFRPVRELDATKDRDRFVKDDGKLAREAAAANRGSGSLSLRPPPPPTASTGSETTEPQPPEATRGSGPSTTASPSRSGTRTPATTTTPARPKS